MSDPKTVLVTSPTFGEYSEESLDLLRDHGCEPVHLDREDPEIDTHLAEHLPRASAWVVGYLPVDAETLDRAPALEVIAKHGTGVDNIDLEAARERGVVVTNAPGLNANAVAELVVLHILNHSRRLVEADREVRAGRWEPIVGREVAGATLGIVGLGAIGQALVVRTQGFELDYLAHDLEDRSGFRARYDVAVADDLDYLLARADFVSLHVPLNEHTRHLIGPAELEAMKPTACLINTARGGIVDEAALLDALAAGEIGGAALDVLEEEPPGDSAHYDALRRADRIALTPHMGGYTEEAFEQISLVTARNILRVFDGEEPDDRVA